LWAASGRKTHTGDAAVVFSCSSARSTALFSAARARPRIHTHPSGRIASSARPNLRAVQELLGHAWVTTTQRHTHLEVEDLQAQVADLPANRPAGVG